MTYKSNGRMALLKNERGATILMALLALLVAAMVSAVILAAATSTVKQEKSDAEFQQCQLDLQSAGQFTLHDIIGADESKSSKDGGGAVVTLTEMKTTDSGGDVQWVPSSLAAAGGGSFYKNVLRDAVDAIRCGNGTVVNGVFSTDLPDITLSKKAAATSSSSDFEPRTVKVSFTAKPAATVNGVPSDDYDYVFEFNSSNSVKDIAADADRAQVLYLRLKENNSSPVVSSDGKTRVTTYYWTFDRFYTAEGKDDING